MANLRSRCATSVLFFVIALSLLCPAQAKSKSISKTSKAEEEVRAVMDQLREAQLRNDVSTLKHIYADDYALTESDGNMFTKAERIAAIGKLKFDSIKLDDVKVRIYGNAAVMTYRPTVKFLTEPHGPFQFQVTSVFVKRGGSWQVVGGHESFISPDAK